jgi:hypothetical protein
MTRELENNSFIRIFVNRMMVKNLYIIFFLIFLLGLSSCGGGEKTDDVLSEEDETTKPTLLESKFNAQNVFNSLPDRKLIIRLIEDNKLEYNPDFLNNPNSVKKYSTELYKAINLGIYGSDLSISSSFDQTQESMIFLKCVNILANNLGVNSAFDQRLFERIDNNNNNKDSVLEIITDAFRKVDEILKYNNRPATSAIILSGCWIEGLYVSCLVAENVNTEAINKTIINQKESLKHLIVMLDDVKLDEDSKFILNDLKDLYKAFETAEKSEKFDLKALSEISTKVKVLRKKVASTPDL